MKIKEIQPYIWEIEQTGSMLVPGRVYTDAEGMGFMKEEHASRPDWSALQQVENVAKLPGIQRFSLALADVHVGYGSPIGGVAAMDLQEGVITFGAVGFDINCGVNCLSTPLEKKDIEGDLDSIADALFRSVPAGLGRGGDIRLSPKEVDEMLVKGARYALEKGYGTKRDLEYTEMGGVAGDADVSTVSDKAHKRMHKQLGTLGSGNHYLELQYVDEVFDEKTASAYGLRQGQVVLFIHCGSRGLGHQIGSECLEKLALATKKHGIEVAHRELVCAPIQSREGRDYFGAVNAGVNTAFANRQVIGALARKALAKSTGIAEDDVALLYGVGHNTAKVEEHEVEGKKRKLLVHRKGSTRAFGPGHQELPAAYASVGQPILVGGTMGTASYIFAGTETAMKETFGSGVHGAGRAMSRTEAKKNWTGSGVVNELKQRGILIKAHSDKGVAEEAPGAYKDIERVADIMDKTGVNRKVVRLKPLIVVKG